MAVYSPGCLESLEGVLALSHTGVILGSPQSKQAARGLRVTGDREMTPVNYPHRG